MTNERSLYSQYTFTEDESDASLVTLEKSHAMAEFTLTGQVVAANSQFCTLFGYRLRELTAVNHSDLLPQQGGYERGAFWDDVLAGHVTSGEFKRRNKSGERVWVHAAYTLLLDALGRVKGVVLMAIDITHQKWLHAEYSSRLDAIERSHSVVEFTPDGKMLRVNANFLKLTGCSEIELIGHDRQLLKLRQDNRAPEEDFWQALLRGDFISGRFQLVGKNDRQLWVQATFSPIFDTEGNVTKIISFVDDITDSVITEHKMDQQGKILDILLSAHHGFLLDHNLGSACDTVFERLLTVTGSEFGFIGIVQYEDGKPCLYLPSISNISWDEATRAWYNQQRREHGGLYFRNLDNLFGHVVTHNTVVLTNNLPNHPASRGSPAGHPQINSVLGIPVRHHGQAIGMIALANHPNGYQQSMVELLNPLVTTLGTLIHARALEDQRSQMEASLRFSAHHDFLTALPNRSHFFSTTTRWFYPEEEMQSPPAGTGSLVLVDVDLFKRINDKFGHLAGDEVLKTLAKIMSDPMFATDLVARMGGEEFVILFRNAPHGTVREVIERMRQAIEQSLVMWEGEEVRFTISAGIAPWHPRYRSVDDWFQAADRLLYTAKREGRNRIA